MISPVHFLFCNLFVSALLGILLLVRRIGSRHLSIPVRYHLWHLFTAALFLPFFPWQSLSSQEFLFWIQELLAFDKASAVLSASGNSAQTAAPGTVIQDLSMASVSSGWRLSNLLYCIWIAGMAAAAFYFICILVKIHQMKRDAFLVTSASEPELHKQFASCIKELSIKQKISLYTSCGIQNPISCGCLRPCVIIPQDLDVVFSEEELRFIFLHELQHCKHRDSFLNLLICVLETLYWFNPLIWYGFHQFEKDREIACDHAIIQLIGSKKRLHYGLTIIHFAEHVRRGIFASPLSGISSNESTTKQRVAEIIEYHPSSAVQQLKSAFIFALIFLLLLGTSPLLSAYAFVPPALHLSDGEWQAVDLSDSFDEKDSSFVLYDMQTKEYYIYNKEKSEERISPASTFKIYSGLFALEEGLITPDASIQKWDGSMQPFDAWMQDQTLSSAMQNSVNWYFQNLDQKMGLASLASYYSRISYGNCDLSGGTHDYWTTSLAISPLEQVYILSGLLDNQWDFNPENVQTIKNSLLLSTNSISGGKLYGKTGSIGTNTGDTSDGLTNQQDNDSQQTGWFVGFLETGESTYCFAANMQGSGCDGNTAASAAVDALFKIIPSLTH